MDLQFHGTEEQLEDYALGRLSDSDVPAFEEHLLICATCQDRLEGIDAFTQGMRLALSEPDSISLPERQTTSVAGNWFSWFRLPQLGFAVAAASLVFVIGFYLKGSNQNLLPAASLQLSAMRGEMPFLPQAKTIDLTLLDSSQAGGPWRAEVVDGTGAIKWTGRTEPAPGGARIQIARSLKPGDYFVRLYEADGALLHEYGFRVRQ